MPRRHADGREDLQVLGRARHEANHRLPDEEERRDEGRGGEGEQGVGLEVGDILGVRRPGGQVEELDVSPPGQLGEVLTEVGDSARAAIEPHEGVDVGDLGVADEVGAVLLEEAVRRDQAAVARVP